MPATLRFAGLLLPLVLVGCQETPAQPAPEKPAPTSNVFDAAQAGTIAGRVVWDGPTPQVPRFKAYPNLSYDLKLQFTGEVPNPNEPKIDRKTRGIAQTVVYLRQVAPEKTRPWNLPVARVETKAYHMQVTQGEQVGGIGFVKRGTEIDLVNEDMGYARVKARGAAFFSLPLIQAGVPMKRRFDKIGVVELSAGGGAFWMQSYLFVDDHPYYTRTDAQGTFSLAQVPPGTYQLVCWHPNWEVAQRERDPESGNIYGILYADPLVRETTVRVEPGQISNIDFRFTAPK